MPMLRLCDGTSETELAVEQDVTGIGRQETRRSG